MKLILIKTFFAVILLPVCLTAQEADSVKTTDSTIVTDSLNVQAETDSTMVDTLTAAQRAYQQFKEREAERLDSLQILEEEKKVIYFSFTDSLKSYFLSDKIDEMPELTASFYRDAGDYYKLNPGYFRIEYEATPDRKTVQPFGLTGDKMNFNINGLNYNPFEHNIEPDGLVDYNEIPTSLNHHVYQLDGATGMIFGSDQAYSTLLTRPDDYDSLKIKTGLLVDKGGFDYNFVRGYILKQFRDGRKIDLSVDYRNGFDRNNIGDQDHYQYSGKTFMPIGKNFVLNFQGLAYMGKKEFYSPDTANFNLMSQIKKEQMVDFALEKQNGSNSGSFKIGGIYQYHSSHFDKVYKGRFDVREYEGYLSFEKMVGYYMASLKISGKKDRYSDGLVNEERDFGKATFLLSNLDSANMLSLTTSLSYYEDYDMIPGAALVYKHETGNFLSILSLGYAERVPSLHELYLSPQNVEEIHYGLSTYRESGNPELNVEKQMTASFTVTHNLKALTTRFSVTGGKIKDGIDWNSGYSVTDSISHFQFRPVNHDYDFVNVTLREKLRISSFMFLYGGGSYRKVNDDDEIFDSYLPEFQAFGAGELHIYWKQRNIHFYAYGEVMTSDDYLPLTGNIISNDPIINSKLSFQIKKFRFYYIFQNSLSREYTFREGNQNDGRFVTYGFTWNFLD